MHFLPGFSKLGRIDKFKFWQFYSTTPRHKLCNMRTYIQHIAYNTWLHKLWTDNEYWSRLTHAIELTHQINENIVISVDLNPNLFNVNNNKLVDLMITFNSKNVIVKPTTLNNLLDPIIISDTMTPLYSDVFKMPSENRERPFNLKGGGGLCFFF